MSELPKFGYLTNPVVDILKEIKAAARLGFDYVEIGLEWPEGTVEYLLRKKDRILDLLRKHKIFAVGHTAWWIDFSSPYQAVRKAWIIESKRKIDIAKELGIKKTNFHAFSSRSLHNFPENYVKTLLNNCVLSLREIVKYGKKFGMITMLENCPKGITDFEDFKYIIDNVPGLKVNFDVAHAFVCSGMKDVKKYIKNFSSKIEHVHLSDNHGKEDEHLPIGKGDINFKKVVKMLKHINYDKTITLEVFTENEKDVVGSRERIEKLWEMIKCLKVGLIK